MSEPIQEALQVELESGGGQIDTEAIAVEHLRVQLAENADGDAVDHHISLHALDESGVLAGHELEGPPLRALLCLVLRLEVEGVEELVKSTMCDFEAALRVRIESSHAPHVSAADLLRGLLDHSVADLEDPQWLLLALVLSQCLQDARQ